MRHRRISLDIAFRILAVFIAVSCIRIAAHQHVDEAIPVYKVHIDKAYIQHKDIAPELMDSLRSLVLFNFPMWADSVLHRQLLLSAMKAAANGRSLLEITLALHLKQVFPSPIYYYGAKELGTWEVSLLAAAGFYDNGSFGSRLWSSLRGPAHICPYRLSK